MKYNIRIKTHGNKKLSELIQECFFKLGGKWASGDVDIRFFGEKYLYLRDNCITWSGDALLRHKSHIGTEHTIESLLQLVKDHEEGKNVESWRAEEGDEYYVSISRGGADGYIENDDRIDNDLHKRSNYWKSAEHAELYSKKCKKVGDKLRRKLGYYE